MIAAKLSGKLTTQGLCNTYLEKCLKSCSTLYLRCYYISGKVEAKNRELPERSIYNQICKKRRSNTNPITESMEVIKLLRNKDIEDNFIVSSLTKCPSLMTATKKEIGEAIDQLKQLQFSDKQSLEILSSNPELVSAEFTGHLIKVLSSLRSLGVEHRMTLTAVLYNPLLVSFPIEGIKVAHDSLLQNFSKDEIKSIILKSPNVLTDDVEDVERKANYGFSKMGIHAKLMSNSNFFSHSFTDILVRHGFLERSGLYKTTNEFEDNHIESGGSNPLTRHIFTTDDKFFSRVVAKSTLEEYQAFRSIITLECIEKAQAEAEEEEEEEVQEKENDDDELELILN